MKKTTMTVQEAREFLSRKITDVRNTGNGSIEMVLRVALFSCSISDKDFEDIIICLERPSLLIGVKGSNIDALQAYLDKQDVTGKNTNF